MPLFSFEGQSPRVNTTAFVAPTATLIGDVVVEAGASVWYNAVLRGDYGPIREEFFGPKMPAHTLVAVAGLAFPEFLIEVEAIAVL